MSQARQDHLGELQRDRDDWKLACDGFMRDLAEANKDRAALGRERLEFKLRAETAEAEEKRLLEIVNTLIAERNELSIGKARAEADVALLLGVARDIHKVEPFCVCLACDSAGVTPADFERWGIGQTDG